ncbi:MAG TPA: hypothetical protein VIL95_07325 [Bacillota bacterium]
MADREISPEELRRRRKQLAERKYSFIELIMQIRKKMHKEKWQKEHDRPDL